jgi:hypothetical protein
MTTLGLRSLCSLPTSKDNCLHLVQGHPMIHICVRDLELVDSLLIPPLCQVTPLHTHIHMQSHSLPSCIQICTTWTCNLAQQDKKKGTREKPQKEDGPNRDLSSLVETQSETHKTAKQNKSRSGNLYLITSFLWVYCMQRIKRVRLSSAPPLTLFRSVSQAWKITF